MAGPCSSSARGSQTACSWGIAGGARGPGRAAARLVNKPALAASRAALPFPSGLGPGGPGAGASQCASCSAHGRASGCAASSGACGGPLPAFGCLGRVGAKPGPGRAVRALSAGSTDDPRRAPAGGPPRERGSSGSEEQFGWQRGGEADPLESVSESAVMSEDQAALLSTGAKGSAASNGEADPLGALTAGLEAAVREAAAGPARETAAATMGATASSAGALEGGFVFDEKEAEDIRDSWESIMRWSRVFRYKTNTKGPDALVTTKKVVVFGAGSFGTSMASVLAHNKKELDVVLLLRDPYLAMDINTSNHNTKYLPDYRLPKNLRATTSAEEAIKGAQYAVHAVPVQHSRKFLQSIQHLLPPDTPIISVSKGLEVGTGLMMSELIPSALNRKQPMAFVSGPSFAAEVMQHNPTGVVAASKDRRLATAVQQLFANPQMRVNTTTDVTGVEICGALKNVLAIAAGITEGLDLGHNALAALVAQGCAEIRWLAEKMGAKPATLSGLSGLGDIMLTCYVNLSRNRTVGVRLGRGEALSDILASSTQVAEGVATAGVVVNLARKYRVQLPVLTAVATILNGEMSPRQAVEEIMNLPQIEEH